LLRTNCLQHHFAAAVVVAAAAAAVAAVAVAAVVDAAVDMHVVRSSAAVVGMLAAADKLAVVVAALSKPVVAQQIVAADMLVDLAMPVVVVYIFPGPSVAAEQLSASALHLAAVAEQSTASYVLPVHLQPLAYHSFSAEVLVKLAVSVDGILSVVSVAVDMLPSVVVASVDTILVAVSDISPVAAVLVGTAAVSLQQHVHLTFAEFVGFLLGFSYPHFSFLLQFVLPQLPYSLR